MRERAIPRRILAAHAHAHASRRTAPSPRRRTSAHRAACARCAQTSKTIATRFRTRRLSAVALPRGACARRVRRHWETPATLAWPCSHTPGDHTRACTARPAAKRRAGQKQALTCFDDSLLAMATACRLLPPPVCTGKEVTCVVLRGNALYRPRGSNSGPQANVACSHSISSIYARFRNFKSVRHSRLDAYGGVGESCNAWARSRRASRGAGQAGAGVGRAGSCSACCSAAAGDAAMAEQDAEELVAKAEKKLKVLGRVSREAKRACMAGARRNGQACECPPAPADAARAARPVMGVCGCWRSVRRRKRRGRPGDACSLAKLHSTRCGGRQGVGSHSVARAGGGAQGPEQRS